MKPCRNSSTDKKINTTRTKTHLEFSRQAVGQCAECGRHLLTRESQCLGSQDDKRCPMLDPKIYKPTELSESEKISLDIDFKYDYIGNGRSKKFRKYKTPYVLNLR